MVWERFLMSIFDSLASARTTAVATVLSAFDFGTASLPSREADGELVTQIFGYPGHVNVASEPLSTNLGDIYTAKVYQQ